MSTHTVCGVTHPAACVVTEKQLTVIGELCLTVTFLSLSECKVTYWRTVMAVGHLRMDFTATSEKLRLSGSHCSMKSNK